MLNPIEISWDALKQELKGIIANEDKHNPLSDAEIAVKFKEQGIELEWKKLRRYRQILDIDPPTKRREFYSKYERSR
jgi:DNA-directed RNA polymerase specialized sigma54-like protein